MIAVVLAAGESTRFGQCKQLASVEGVPMLAHVLRQLPESLEKWVILGDQREPIEKLVLAEGANPCFNPDFAKGMMTSVRKAARLAQDRESDLLMTLGDLPFVSTSDYLRLTEAFSGQPLFSEFSNQMGPPAVFPLDFLETILTKLDAGGVKGLVDRPLTVPIPNAAKDVDTPSDLR